MKFSINEVFDFSRRTLSSFGASDEDANIVSERLVHADQCGHLSHGIIRLLHYHENYTEKILDTSAVPEVIINDHLFVKLDAKRSFGQVAAKKLTEEMFEKYTKNNLVIGTLANSNHVGRIVEYSEFYTSGNIASLTFANGGGPGVCPFGSNQRKLGTNPISLFIRLGSKKISIDVASAAIAEGKLNVARINNKKINKNLILTKDGLDTDDPNEFYKGGAIQTAGGTKGFALSIIIELLAGILTGNGSSAFKEHIDGNGFLQIFFSPTAFIDQDSVENLIESLVEEINNTKPMQKNGRVLFPGEPEEINYSKNKEVIEIPDPNIESLNKLASLLEIKGL